MPQIKHIANLWSLQGHPSSQREWTLEMKIKAIAAAGFDGLTCALTAAHRRLAEKHGLPHLLGFISTSEPDEFKALIQGQKDGGAVHINVQLDDHDTPPALAARHWLQMTQEAERIGDVVVSLEVHRDCCTETPEKTYELAARYHEATGKLIKINFDFSHFAVVKHLAPENYRARLLDHPELVVNSEQCHLRPFNGHHCQVPVTHRGRLTTEVKTYLEFVRALMELWRRAPGNKDKTLFVCPEMGPHAGAGAGYNISGLPPAWPDAITLRTELAKVWNAQREGLSRQSGKGPST